MTIALIYTIIGIIYTLLSIAAFIHYRDERTMARITLAAIAPFVLVVVAATWCVSRLEELG